MGEESAVCMRVRCKEWGRSPHRGDQVDTIISEGQSMPGCHRAPTDTRHIRSSAEISVTLMIASEWRRWQGIRPSPSLSAWPTLALVPAEDYQLQWPQFMRSLSLGSGRGSRAGLLPVCRSGLITRAWGQQLPQTISLHYTTWHVRYGRCWWAW